VSSWFAGELYPFSNEALADDRDVEYGVDNRWQPARHLRRTTLGIAESGGIRNAAAQVSSGGNGRGAASTVWAFHLEKSPAFCPRAEQTQMDDSVEAKDISAGSRQSAAKKCPRKQLLQLC